MIYTNSSFSLRLLPLVPENVEKALWREEHHRSIQSPHRDHDPPCSEGCTVPLGPAALGSVFSPAALTNSPCWGLHISHSPQDSWVHPCMHLTSTRSTQRTLLGLWEHRGLFVPNVPCSPAQPLALPSTARSSFVPEQAKKGHVCTRSQIPADLTLLTLNSPI